MKNSFKSIRSFTLYAFLAFMAATAAMALTYTSGGQWPVSVLYVYAISTALLAGSYMAITLNAQYFWSRGTLDWLKPAGILAVFPVLMMAYASDTHGDAVNTPYLINSAGILLVTIIGMFVLNKKYDAQHIEKLYQEACDVYRDYMKYNTLTAPQKMDVDDRLGILELRDVERFNLIFASVQRSLGDDTDLFSEIAHHHN
jgi:hypothetical protein